MTESSIYQSSLSKVVAYGVKAYMRQHLFAYEFVVKIAEYLYPCPDPQIVYETSFLLKEDLNVKAFKKTLVALSELLFPESKEKEREFKRALFKSVTPGCKRWDDILTAESGSFPFPVDKPLPTGEELASKLTPIYVALSNEVEEEEETDSPEPQLKESELIKEENEKEKTMSYVSGKKIKDLSIANHCRSIFCELEILLRQNETQKGDSELISDLIYELDKLIVDRFIPLTYDEISRLREWIVLYDYLVESGQDASNLLILTKTLLEDSANKDLGVIERWVYLLNSLLDPIKKSLDLVEPILEDSSLKEKIEEDKELCQEITNLLSPLENLHDEIHALRKLPSHLVKEIEKFNTRVEEKIWEGKRKDKVEGLLGFINYLLQKAEREKDEFSDYTEYKDYVDGLSKIKEKLENEKDSLIEKEFYSLFSSVHQIYDRRITNLLNRN